MLDFPKTYMAYWYSNSKNFRYNYIEQHINNIKQSFQKQKDNFAALEKSAKPSSESLENAKGANALLTAFSEAGSGTTLEQILCINIPDSNQIMQDAAQKVFDKFLGDNGSIWQKVRNAYKDLKQFKTAKEKNINEYCNQLEDLVKTTITAAGGNASLLDEYKTCLMGHIMDNMMTADSVTEAAKKAANELGVGSKGGQHDACALVVNSFLTKGKMPDKFYEIDFKGNQELKAFDEQLSDSLKRTLVFVMALPEIDFSNVTGINTFTVRHGNGTIDELKGDNLGIQILEALMEKNERAFLSIVGATAYESIVTSLFNELSSVFAQLPDDEIVKDFNRTGNARYRANISGISITAEGEFKSDPLFEEFFRTSGQDAEKMTRGSNKADTAISEYGFSLKTLTSRDMEIDPKTKSQGIKILSGSPLSTLIAREAGLGSSGLYHTLQLAMGHGVDEEGGWGGYAGMKEADINATWEQWKNALLSLAFINALTGNQGAGGKIAYQMIYDDRIYHMTDIIKLYEDNNLNNNGQFGSLTVDGSGEGLEREAYINYWNQKPVIEHPRRKGMNKAIERSNRYVAEGSKIMYATKIKILINAAMLPKL